ncbi:MAG: hypothetical protein NT069_05460 [Planctomycetota bacterium]|nr:hypothetical protein [Planctomycetota bacterium]
MCAGFAFSSDSRHLMTLTQDGRLRTHLLDERELLAVARRADFYGHDETEFSRHLGEQYSQVEQQLELQTPGRIARLKSWDEGFDVLVALQCKNAPLDQVIDSLCASLGLPAIFDHKGVEESGVRFDTPVTLTARNISARTLLEVLLTPLHLGVSLRDKVLWITSESQDDLHELPLSQFQKDRQAAVNASMSRLVSVASGCWDLTHVINFLNPQAHWEIVVDGLATRELEGVGWEDSRIHEFKAQDEPISEVLDRLLTPLRLRYVLHADVIRITAMPDEKAK